MLTPKVAGATRDPDRAAGAKSGLSQTGPTWGPLRLTCSRAPAASWPPDNHVRVAGKTCILQSLRHEVGVGVVQFGHDPPIAVAVFTHAVRADPVLPRADAVIGETAELAVQALHRS